MVSQQSFLIIEHDCSIEILSVLSLFNKISVCSLALWASHGSLLILCLSARGRGCFWAVLISWLNQGSNEFSYCLRVETHILTFTSCLNVDISSYTCLFISCCINMSLTLMHLLGCLKHPLSMRVSFSCSPLPLPITTYSSIKLIASCSKVCARNVIYFLFSPIFSMITMLMSHFAIQ